MPKLRPGQLENTTGSTDNDTVTTKGYVDDQSGTGAAIHENLIIAAPGQTAFTLGSTPADATQSILTLNGQTRKYGGSDDYTISGTTLTWNDPGGLTLLPTDELQIWYNVSIGGGILDQLQIYYVSKSGNDSNNGKSIERPFLTITKANSEIKLQSPSSSNRFALVVIGAANYTENLTGGNILANWTVFYAESANFAGTIECTNAIIYLNEHLGLGSGSNVIVNGAHTVYYKANKVLAGNNSIGVNLSNGATLRSEVGEWDLTGSGSKVANLATGAVFYNHADKLRENVASTNDGSATQFMDIRDYGSNADSVMFNEAGDIILDAKNNKIILKESAIGTIFESIGIYPKWTNTPLVIARVSPNAINAVGDGNAIDIPFNSEDYDIGNNYNNTTFTFKSPVTAVYTVAVSFAIGDITSSSWDELTCYISSTGGSTQSIDLDLTDPYVVRRKNANSYANSGSSDIVLAAGDDLTIKLNIGTHTKTLPILEGTRLTISLKTVV